MTNPFGHVMIALAVGFAALGATQAQAESIKIGLSKLLSYPATPIAIERGYFKAEGIDAQMVFFDSAQPIAVAVASGDVDFGVSGLSAGFYTLAAHGQLRLIASSAGEQPGFYNLVFLGSNKAYDAGLKTAKDLARPRDRDHPGRHQPPLQHRIAGARNSGFPMSA